MTEERIILLNALPLNSFLYSNFNIAVKRLDNLQELKKRIERIDETKETVVNFIRHPATVKLLSSALGIQLDPMPMLYQYFPGDRIFVITLSQFQERGKEKEQLSENDILIYEVDIYGAR